MWIRRGFIDLSNDSKWVNNWEILGDVDIEVLGAYYGTGFSFLV